MPIKNSRHTRLGALALISIVLLVMGGLLFWQGDHEISKAEFFTVSLLLVMLCAFSYYFLQQLRKLEQFNLKLEEQQTDLELKAELLDIASDVVLLLDKDANFLYFNKALSHLTGYAPEELQQVGLHGIEPPEYAARIKGNINNLIENGEAVFESAYLHKSGCILPIEVHGRIADIRGRTLILSVVRDIGERKKVEQRLILSAQEWQGTFDAVEDAVWLLDMNRKIVRANRATLGLSGKSAQEVVGMDCCVVAHNEPKPALACPFNRMLKSKKRATSQLALTDRWFEVSLDPVFSESGEIVNAVHIVKDITNLKKAELREHTRSEILERIAGGERMTQLLTFIAASIEKESPGALCSIMLVDDAGKRLLNGAAPNLPEFYNLATQRTKIGEGIGSCGTAAFRRERVIVEDIDNHPFWKGFTAAKEAGLRSCWSEPIIASTGELLGTFALYHSEPAVPEEEEIRLIEQAALFAGIAIERSREKSLRFELEQMLGQSQKLEAIGHLAGGIAHDFNNLLTPIMIYAEMLKKSAVADENALKKIEGIIKASLKARDLTQQLLSFGRKQVMKMEPLDLDEIILSFNSIIRRTVPENIDIKLKLAAQEGLIRADRSKLEQIILNLAINARDAISETGVITIETSRLTIDDEHARLHPGMKPGEYIQLDFSDNGCGMSEETLQHVFEPFFSTKEVGKGTGLGLASVYGIVKQHNGYISVQSEVGGGAVFRLYFPATAFKPNQPRPPVEEGGADFSGGESILLVEDDESLRTMICDLLEGLGYRVYPAGHPDMALEIAGRKSLKIDLIITDVIMPGMNGKQLVERITTDRPELNKVLYISGYTNRIIETNSELNDGLHFLQKPFTVDALMVKVKWLLRMER